MKIIRTQEEINRIMSRVGNDAHFENALIKNVEITPVRGYFTFKNVIFYNCFIGVREKKFDSECVSIRLKGHNEIIKCEGKSADFSVLQYGESAFKDSVIKSVRSSAYASILVNSCDVEDFYFGNAPQATYLIVNNDIGDIVTQLSSIKGNGIIYDSNNISKIAYWATDKGTSYISSAHRRTIERLLQNNNIGQFLFRGHLSYEDLSGLDFGNIKISEVEFNQCIMDGVDMSGVDIGESFIIFNDTDISNVKFGKRHVIDEISREGNLYKRVWQR